MFHYCVGGNILCFQINCNIGTVMCSTQHSGFYIVIAIDKTLEEKQWGLQKHFWPWVCRFACIFFLLAVPVLPYSASSLTQRLFSIYGYLRRYRCLWVAGISALTCCDINVQKEESGGAIHEDLSIKLQTFEWRNSIQDMKSKQFIL